MGSKHPYVVRTSSNNGIRAYLDEDEKYLNLAKTTSSDQDTATMFYQKTPYFTEDKIKILTSIKKELNPETACFYVTMMKKGV